MPGDVHIPVLPADFSTGSVTSPEGQPGALYFCTWHNGKINLALVNCACPRGQGGSGLVDGALEFPTTHSSPLPVPLFGFQQDIEATWPFPVFLSRGRGCLCRPEVAQWAGASQGTRMTFLWLTFSLLSPGIKKNKEEASPSSVRGTDQAFITGWARDWSLAHLALLHDTNLSLHFTLGSWVLWGCV
jgi:hypothetical protein